MPPNGRHGMMRERGRFRRTGDDGNGGRRLSISPGRSRPFVRGRATGRQLLSRICAQAAQATHYHYLPLPLFAVTRGHLRTIDCLTELLFKGCSAAYASRTMAAPFASLTSA